MYKLFLDDERFPTDTNSIIMRNFNDACEYVLKKWSPNVIFFDHDLWIDINWQIGKTWYDFAKWFVEQDISWKIKIPKNFIFYVHSMNPIGKKNIEDYLNNYLQFKLKNE